MKILLVAVGFEERKFFILKEKLIKGNNSVAVVTLAPNMTHEDLTGDEVIIFANDPRVIISKEARTLIEWADNKKAQYLYLNESTLGGQTLLPNLGGDIKKLEVFV